MEQQLKVQFGDHGGGICALWRQKQLEYSFRRGLMRCYADFDTCTQQALQFALKTFKVDLPDTAQRQLLADYLNLPLFLDVLPAMQALQSSGYMLLAFSNGVESSLRVLLNKAGILTYLAGIVSVDAIKTFKPNPDVYTYLVGEGGCRREDTWLVSANPFDVIGAKSAKLKGAWIRRNPETVFDPWEFEPDIQVSNLTDLEGGLRRHAKLGPPIKS
jgi:2-haloacid dehalogenase